MEHCLSINLTDKEVMAILYVLNAGINVLESSVYANFEFTEIADRIADDLSYRCTNIK